MYIHTHTHALILTLSNAFTLHRASTTTQQEIRAEAGYETPTNMIHACNATFSPDRKTPSSMSALHAPPGECEEVSTVKVTIGKDSIKVTQRYQYEMIERDE